MKILNYGSLNLDYVYQVDHIVQPGETTASLSLEVFCGGKGLNQSVALSRAGCPQVYHAGMVGPDGGPLLSTLSENGINTTYIHTTKERSGNAIIQVSSQGQNSIVLFGGANRCNEKTFVDETLASFGEGDLLLLQNEINLVDYLIEQAAAKGMRIALNPSPFDASLLNCKLDSISIFLMNEVEGEQLTGETNPDRILMEMKHRFPNACTLLTLGGQGCMCMQGGEVYKKPAYNVSVVDTTAAGDTFTGYFLTVLTEGKGAEAAINIASKASALAVSRPGAAGSIPLRTEVDAYNPS